MKRIRRLPAPIPGLAEYRENARDAASWRGYRGRGAGTRRYRRLIDGLADLQHGLCGYCEIDLLNDRQVEHVVPISDPDQGAALALEAANMIACCLGGGSDSPQIRQDRERFSPGEASCGLAKGNRTLPDRVDPRELPELPSLTHVRLDGYIEADASACRTAQRSASDVTKAIEILGLNVPRLLRARRDFWDNLRRVMPRYQGNSDAIRRWAQNCLLPRNGSLRKFFTTSRSYFGELGERILAEKPRNWV